MEKVNEKEREFRHGTYGPKYLIKGPKWEGGLMILRLGDELGAHYHNEVEETFYFLEGKGVVKVNESEYQVVKGDVVRIEPKEVHNILKIEEEIKAIFIKCPFKPEDKVSV